MTAADTTRPRRRRAPTPSVPLDDSALPGSDDLCGVRCIDEARVERARALIPGAENVAALAETFRILGDPTRLRIVRALMAEELCVCDLATLLELSSPTVSHSLRALRQLRLVRYRKVGKVAYYAIDDDHVRQLVDTGFVHVGETARAFR